MQKNTGIQGKSERALERESWTEKPPAAAKHEILSAQLALHKRETAIVQTLTYEACPISIYPDSIADFISAVARSIGCDDSFAALPMLAVLSHAIGATRVIEIKSSWRESPLVWCLLIARSGSAKSPALELIVQTLYRRQRQAALRHAAASEAHTKAVILYEKALRDWQKSKGSCDPPEKPTDPVLSQFILEDCTIESVADILNENPRGCLGVYDEWAKWHSMQGRYSGGKDESGDWLKLFGCRPLMVNRKTGKKFTYVARPFLSLIATTQPETYRRLISSQSQESGLDQRWLKAMPPQNKKRWSDATIPLKVEQAFLKTFERMHTMSMDVTTQEAEPFVVKMSKTAKAAWIDFYEQHAIEQGHQTEHVSSVYSKLEGYCGRFALIIHCARQAAGESVSELVIDEESIQRAITLTRWYAHESLRVDQLLTETPSESEQRRLIEWIQRQGGSSTTRDLLTNSRTYRTASEADAALQQLVTTGQATWVQTAHTEAGRPARRIVLTETENENVSTVSVCTIGLTQVEKANCADRLSVLEESEGNTRCY